MVFFCYTDLTLFRQIDPRCGNFISHTVTVVIWNLHKSFHSAETRLSGNQSSLTLNHPKPPQPDILAEFGFMKNELHTNNLSWLLTQQQANHSIPWLTQDNMMSRLNHQAIVSEYTTNGGIMVQIITLILMQDTAYQIVFKNKQTKHI